MGNYKYVTAQDWMMQRVESEYHHGEFHMLLARLQMIIPKIDADTIQGLFEGDMDDDGYFDEECND